MRHAIAALIPILTATLSASHALAALPRLQAPAPSPAQAAPTPQPNDSAPPPVLESPTPRAAEPQVPAQPPPSAQDPDPAGQPVVSSKGAPPPGAASRTEDLQQQLARQLDRFRDIFSLTRIAITLLIIALTYVLVRLFTFVMERMAARRTLHGARLLRAIPLVTFTLWFLAGLLVLTGVYGGSALTVFFILAILGGAFVFASQSVLKDLVGGVVIVLERPFQIGDRVRVGAHYGEVRKIGLRAFELTAEDGSQVVIPNAEVLRESVANANPGTLERQVTAEILLPASIDLDRAKRIAFEAAAVSPYVYAKKPIEIHVDSDVGEGRSTKIVVRTYVLDARYENELRSDIMELSRRAIQKIEGQSPQSPNP